MLSRAWELHYHVLQHYFTFSGNDTYVTFCGGYSASIVLTGQTKQYWSEPQKYSNVGTEHNVSFARMLRQTGDCELFCFRWKIMTIFRTVERSFIDLCP